MQMIETPFSSNVKEIGWDANTQDLQIRFKSGGLYCYHNVPMQVWLDFRDAASKGHYFRDNIKGQYSWEKVAS